MNDSEEMDGGASSRSRLEPQMSIVYVGASRSTGVVI